jgi:hypothetical protein
VVRHQLEVGVPCNTYRYEAEIEPVNSREPITLRICWLLLDHL